MEDKHYLKEELYTMLRTDPELFEWIEQGSVDGMWYWDLEDGEQEWLSPKFKSTFGFGMNEIPHTSKWWQENIHPDDLTLAMDNFDKHAADPNHPYDQIVRYKHKNGSTVWVRCRGLITKRHEGKPTRMLGVHSDVTELKQVELKLEEKTQELARSNEELKQFAYVASHDLKSPINSINMLLGWIDEDCGDELPEVAKKHLSLIKKRNTRMVALLDDLLRYSEVSSLKVEKEHISVKDTISDIFDDISSTSQFTLKVCDQNIVVERIPFELVTRNLLSNARKHHDSDAGNIDVDVTTESDHYRIDVSDDGPGIPQKYQTKIFEMFQTLKPKDQVEGSGMGLAMVSKVMQSINGSVKVTNNPTKGCCFTLIWPRDL